MHFLDINGTQNNGRKTKTKIHTRIYVFDPFLNMTCVGFLVLQNLQDILEGYWVLIGFSYSYFSTLWLLIVKLETIGTLFWIMSGKVFFSFVIKFEFTIFSPSDWVLLYLLTLN